MEQATDHVMIDFETARVNMVESQIRPNGVTDRRILAALATLPREEFAPEALRSLAYVDEDLPLAAERRLTGPLALARLIDLAAVKSGDRVLHIGCATGYATAVLARLGLEIVAVEENGELAEAAAANVAKLGLTNAAVLRGPHSAGAASRAPFDVIFIEGRIAQLPQTLLGQLGDAGRLVAVVGGNAVSKAALWIRNGTPAARTTGFDVAIAVLPGFPSQAPAFMF